MNIPIVCDMSSNILSRPVTVSNFGVIFAGAQKNIGPSGVTLVIIREDLISANAVNNPYIPPVILDYKVFAESNSLYNTPPTFSIYVSGLVFEWILKAGGLQEMTMKNKQKSDLLYNMIDKSQIYKCTVKNEYRSRMNVTFRIWRNGVPDTALEKEFLILCEKSGHIGLSGHRSIGGIRASIYNAMTLEGVESLVKVMKAFEDNRL